MHIIDSVAAIKRIPVGTKLQIVNCLIGPPKRPEFRTIMKIRSKDIVMRIDTPENALFGQSSYLPLPTGTKVESRENGFAVLEDGLIAAEYRFLE
jgi:hypothetical protein